MQNIVDQITDHLSGLIKEDLPTYTPKELLKAGIPSFIVERIRLITEDLLRAEIHKPESIWASMDNELVKHAWRDYVECVFSSSHVPKDYLYDTLNIVVEEVVEVLLEPRQKMADYLFRNFEVLSFDEINRRCSKLTIYKHIGAAIPLYMKKRGLTEITKERCKELIHDLDEKLVANYTADDWAHKLEMLFIMFGGKVQPEMFVTFFEDKGLHRAARLFSTLEEPLNRRGFIAFLASEGTGDLVGDESDQEIIDKNLEAKKGASKKDEVPKEEQTIEEKEESLLDSFFGDYESEEGDKPEALAHKFKKDDEITDSEVEDLISNIDKTKPETEKESLNALFVTPDQEEITSDIQLQKDVDDEDILEFRSNLSSILDQAKDSFDSVMGEPEDEEEPEETEPEETDDQVIDMDELVDEQSGDVDGEITQDPDQPEEDAQSSEDEPDPMWKQFLSEEQMAVMMGSRKQSPEHEEEAPAETIAESLGEDLIEEEAEEQAHVSLEAYLDEHSADFAEGIFSGSRKSYKKAIREIEELNNWDEATEYLQKKVFGSYNTDIFSEVAVEFMDYLQNYFKEHK